MPKLKFTGSYKKRSLKGWFGKNVRFEFVGSNFESIHFIPFLFARITLI